MSNSTDMPNLPTINPDLADILSSLLKRPELNDWSWWDIGNATCTNARAFKLCTGCNQYWKLRHQVVRTVKKTPNDETGGATFQLNDITFVVALDDKCKKVYWYARPNR